MNICGEISRKRRLLEDIIQENDRLKKEANQMKRVQKSFKNARQVLHNINNHCSCIMGYAEMSLRREKQHMLEDYLRKVKKTCKRIGEATASVLCGEETTPYRISFNPLDAIIEANEIRKNADDRLDNIDIVYEFNSEKKIKGNYNTFLDILLNIIKNAEHAMSISENRKMIFKSYEGESNLYLTITDTGSGIENSILGMVFEEGFTTKHILSGQGIGLAYVKQRLEKDFGGNIGISSHKGLGTEVRISMPYENPIHSYSYDPKEVSNC